MYQTREQLMRETKAELVDRIEHMQTILATLDDEAENANRYYRRKCAWWEEHYEMLERGITVVHPIDIAWMRENDPGRPHMGIYSRFLYEPPKGRNPAYVRNSACMYVSLLHQCDECPLVQWYREERYPDE